MSNARPILAGLICVTLLTMAGCDRASTLSAPTPAAATVRKLPTTQMTIAGKPFTLEMAIDPKDQERGLMFRQSMGDDEGMIFVFPNAAPRAFWMKNTTLPLDIAYLDAGGRVLNIPRLVPRDLSSVPSAGPAKYAIELNAGTAEKIGLKPGDRIEIPPALR